MVFVVAMVFFGIAGAAYWQNWSPWIFGGASGAGMFALGFGITAWGKYLMPQGPFVEERHTLARAPKSAMPSPRPSSSAPPSWSSGERCSADCFAVGGGHHGDRSGVPVVAVARPVAQRRVRGERLEGRHGARRLQRRTRPPGNPRPRRHHDRLPAQPDAHRERPGDIHRSGARHRPDRPDPPAGRRLHHDART